MQDCSQMQYSKDKHIYMEVERMIRFGVIGTNWITDSLIQSGQAPMLTFN